MTIVDHIKNASRVLIAGHQRPDGDCLGSGLTMLYLCEKYGKTAEFVCDSDKPAHYDFLPGFDRLNVTTGGPYDLFIAVDCADKLRLGRYQGYAQSCPVSINIDHHKTNERYGKINFITPDASSTCEIVFSMLDEAGELDKRAAYLLFVGLSTDTGHFMHQNTTSRVLEIGAKLLSYGISANEITTRLYKRNTLEKTRLIARAIASMRFFEGKRICLISVTLKDLEECGCVFADTEGLIDYGMNIGEVEVAVCVAETPKPQYKVSFRSKGVDVAAAAAVFGGGGHTLAAGCVVSGHYEDVVAKLVKAVSDGMDTASL